MTAFASKQPYRNGSTNLVIIAIVLAVVAVALNIVYITQLKNKNRQQSFTVYRMKTSAAPGDKFTAKDVAKVDVPEKFHDSFNFAIKDQSLDTNIDKRFQIPVKQGDILAYSMFDPPNIDETIGKIAVGMRRVAIPVNSKTAPGGLRPGVFVDIEANFSNNPGAPDIMPVMEFVKVKAVGRWGLSDSGSRSSSNFRTIDIEVTPEQATLFSVISKVVGEFEIQLRNAGDTQRPKIPGGGINPRVLKRLNLSTTAK